MPRLLRILLVEDSAADIHLVRECLKEGGIACDLSAFTEGETALEFAFRLGRYGAVPRPDIVILDLNLPGLDGAQILQRLKSDKRTRSIPVIMFTGSAAVSDIRRCYDLHANCYITKPMDLEATMEVIRSIQVFWTQVVQLPTLEPFG